MKNKIYIETDGWEENEIDEIVNILDSSGEITKRELKQFELVTAAAIIIGFIIGTSFLKGFGDEMGRDAWKKLKSKFVERTKEKKISTIGFKFQNKDSKIKFNVKSDDPEIVDRALTSVEEKLKEISEKEKDVSFFFDNGEKEWIKIEKTNFIQKYSGIAATTGLVKQGEKSTHFTIEDLNEHAKKMVGTPLTIGHGGKQIGEITKAWVEDEKLMYDAGVYEGTSEADMKILKDIIESGGGVSISFSDDKK